MAYAHCNDIRLFYQLRGKTQTQQTPLLCIPGLGNDSTRWERLVTLLEADFSLIVLDNRGAGRSDAPESDYSARQMAADVAALLEQLGIDQVHVLGHSMGGFIAQELAAGWPDLLHGLVLASTTMRMSHRDRQLLRLWLQGIQNGVDAEWITRDIFFWMYPTSCFDAPGFMDQLVHEALDAPYVQPLHGFAGQVAACTEFDGRKLPEQIKAQSLVLHGELDMLIPLSEAQALAAALPAGSLQVLSGAGHLPLQQMPAIFAEAVTCFLRSL